MYSNLLNLLLFSFFFSFVKKEKGKRVVVNAGCRLRPKQERESRACLRVFFLSEKSTLFAVSGFAAQCCGPAFFVYREAAEDDVRSGRQTGRRWAVGGTREELAGRAIQKERHARSAWKKGRQMFFFFSGKDQEMLSLPSG